MYAIYHPQTRTFTGGEQHPDGTWKWTPATFYVGRAHLFATSLAAEAHLGRFAYPDRFRVVEVAS